MPGPAKIATCCYCGARAALTLTGRERHELACSSCGAPLHNLKMLPKRAKPHRDVVRPAQMRQPKKPPKRKKSRAKRFFDFVEDAFDVIEDILD
ncbi:MAG: hypothetical protein AAF601_02205 [Pseudomonadota bacterium]